VKNNSIEFPLGIFFTGQIDKRTKKTTPRGNVHPYSFTQLNFYVRIKNTNIHQNVQFYSYLFAPGLTCITCSVYYFIIFACQFFKLIEFYMGETNWDIGKWGRC
jgi:hypothetical protein